MIGGGIVGAGVARDAAMRGLRTGLIEQNDFASGTSSRTTRLIHGGIRYLAQGSIGLVRQASKEKRIISHIAPHLAQPMPFIFPTYQGSDWPYWKLRIGVRIYDWLCGDHNLGKSGPVSVDELQQQLPHLNTDQLSGAVRYFDGATNDARLVIDTLRSADRSGATLCNYVRLDDARAESKRWTCQVYDQITEQVHLVRARCVVHATGPWANFFAKSKISVRGTKGVHLVIDHARIPIAEALMMAEQERVVCAIPWGDRVYVGTTDTDYRGALDEVKTDSADIEYLLTVLNRYFPGVVLSEADIIRTWAGVRPLVAQTGRPSEVSRAHKISITDDGWVDVAGGKLTTYRLMAQQVVDKICSQLRLSSPACTTATTPLLENGQAQVFSALLPPPVTEATVKHYCRHEWAIHLDDVMVRRSRWHYYHRDTGAMAERVATWMAQYLGWDAGRVQDELNRYTLTLD